MGKPLKHVLIVDDSKTARITLKKMLEKHAVESAMVESGEDALTFLRDNKPDAIFMDHMMPGMDGFQAVKAIKSTPGLSAIPIVMHTTQHGDIYIGQARALGAVDFLAKPATHNDLVAVLDRVQAGIDEDSGPGKQTHEPSPSRPPRRSLSSDTMEIDAYAIAMAAELAEEEELEAAPPPESKVTFNDYQDFDTQESPAAFLGSARQWLLALIWLVPIAWLLYLYLPLEQSAEDLKSREAHYLGALEWSLNQRESYDFGDEPFSGDVLILMEELLRHLNLAGFQGVIRLEGHIGEFCLSKVTLDDGSEISLLPEPELPLTACGMIGYSPAEAARESVKQSDAFRRFLQQQGLLKAGAPIRVDIVAMGSTQPQYPYPEELEAVTTGDWNSVALSNNRVQIKLLASMPSQGQR